MSAVGCKYVWHIVDDNVGGASEKFKGIHRRTPGRFPRGLAEFITRAFEEDMAIGLDMPPQENTPARRLGCGLRRRGICQRSLLCESERFQSTFRNGRRRAHRPPLHGDRLSGRRRHVYRKQRAGQLYADSADRGLHHRSGRLRGVFPQPFREVMRPRT